MIEIKDIVNNGFCTGCGVCVSEEPGKLSMVMNEDGFLVPMQNELGTKKAVKVCPFNPNPEDVVKDEDTLAEMFLKTVTKFDKRVGKYINCYAGYSKNFRPTSSSGGLATYIFYSLLKNKIVDNLFIVGEKDGGYEYQWFSDKENITKISKTRYYPVTLDKLFLEIDSIDGKVAVSGVPSFIKAIRLKQYYYPAYQSKIVFLAGIVCGGLKSKFYSDYLSQKAGITGDYKNQEYRIKHQDTFALDYSYGAFDSKNKFKTVRMKDVGDAWGTSLFGLPGYDFSDDLSAELADISLGDAWINPYKNDGLGNSIIVTRSQMAEDIIQQGIDSGDLVMDLLGIEKFKLSQAGGFKHKQLGMKHRIKLLQNCLDFLPYKRPRLLQSTPLEYQLVQKQRLHLRDKSLSEWKKTRNVVDFEKAIQKDKQKLYNLTRLYHLIQRIKQKLRLRTI